MRRNRIRLTESQLHRVIKESVKRVLRENEMEDDGIFSYPPHKFMMNGDKYIVVANFYSYTECFKKEIIEEFDSYREAENFVKNIYGDKEFIENLVEDVYDEIAMDDDATTIDDVNFEIYCDSMDEKGHNVAVTTHGCGI